MDYTWDGIKGGGTSPYEKGKYMPILRNHRYIFTIKEVKGPGFATLNEAVTSPDNFTNHNIVVVPIVIDAFTDITFNESGHFLADPNGDDTSRQARCHKHTEQIFCAHQLPQWVEGRSL